MINERHSKFMKEWHRTHKHPRGMLGKKHSEETKKKTKSSLKGRKRPPRSKEWCENISKTRKRLYREGKLKRPKGKLNPMYCKRGKLHPNYGKKASKEWIEKNRLSHLGKKLPEEQKKKIGLASKRLWQNPKYREKMIKIITEIKNLPENIEKSRETTKRLWQNKEYREKTTKAILKGLFKRPTSLEIKFIKLSEKYSFPFKYVGDGEFLIGYKNPDFIITNGKKKCIEVCNSVEYQHPKEYDLKRINHFAKYGWKCLVIRDWEFDDETSLISKINKFMEVK